MPVGFTFFDTAIGTCAIAWSGKGVCALQLPEANDEATRRRLKRRLPEAVEEPAPPAVVTAIAAVQALLRQERPDLSAVSLDLDGASAFERRVYDVARTIAPGETMTYGEIAKRLGEPRAAREVGAALGRNPVAIIVPCHRVLGADGKIGGFSANGGIETKLKMLSIEKARTSAAPSLFGDLPLAAKPRARTG
jgi:methylated-DNA-[protein]-cysteine S-methyltransferase